LAGLVFLCPVCGYPELWESPWSDGAPSDEICPCCGTHFGYDDVEDGDAALREARWVALRQEWTVRDHEWFSRVRRPRPGWNPEEQLSVFD
jgi:hypothetical protein